MDVLVFGIVSKIAREQDQIRPLGQSVDHVDRALERFRAERIRWTIEADVRVTELNK